MKKFLLISFILIPFCPNFSFAQDKLNRFESEILAFEKAADTTVYDPESVLFVGSSSIRMWKSLTEDMAPIPVINRGFGGSTIPEVNYYADRIILPYQPKLLIFYCGENDLANEETTAKDVLKSFKKFNKYMHKNLPDTKVFFLAIKPSIRRVEFWPKMVDANAKIMKYIYKHDNLYFIDTATEMLDDNGSVLQDIFIEDNLHMNAKGYAIWTKVLKPVLLEYYKD